jgi:hypothetical protein
MERHYRSTVMIPEQINATGSLQSILVTTTFRSATGDLET